MSINRKRGSIALARSLCYQINGAADDSDDMDGGGYGSVDVAEILSAEVERLREALAQPVQPEQEPVAWEHHEYRPYGAPGEIRIHAILASQYMMPDGSVSSSFQWLVDEYKKDKNTIKLIPLYTNPPQRPWQGLTDEDWAKVEDMPDTFDQGVAWAAARLKERNT